MADALNLPLDMIEIVLLRLPVKPLLRFKTVSKSWNTMISDPVFIQNHHQRSKEHSNSQNLFLHNKSRIFSNGFSVVKLDDRKLQNVQVLKAPDGLNEILCFCDGLLLVRGGYNHRRIVLWNPSTGAEKRLRLPYTLLRSSYGLCRDPTTGDVKVVILNMDYYYTIYSFNHNCWKNWIKYESNGNGVPDHIGGVCVDGASYWTLSNGFVRKIIYFDPRDDTFKILKKPENIVENKPIYLVDLGGCLCLYCNNRAETVVRIWTKEKGIDNNSWKTLMDVENVGISIWWFRPLCFIGNKIVIRCNNRLVVYNPFEKGFEQFEPETEVLGSVLVPFDSPIFPTRAVAH